MRRRWVSNQIGKRCQSGTRFYFYFQRGGKRGGEGGSDGMRRSGKGAFITLDIGNSLLELIMLLKQASAVSRDEVVKAISEPCHTLAQVIEIARYAWEAGRY